MGAPDAGVEYEQITYEVDDPVATITLHRPEQLNAWTQRMASEVRHAVDRAERDPAVVGIILTGSGRAFCAGADMGNLTALTEGGPLDDAGPLDVAPDPDLPADFAGEYTYLLATSKPIIAAINGAVAGMAVPIALCCDLRFMADDAVFLTAFAQRGLVAEWGVSWLLGRLCGPAVAMDLLISSRKIGGAEAAQLGVVNASMPLDELLPHCRAYIEGLAERCSPASIRTMKRQVHSQMNQGLGAADAEAYQLMLASFTHPDFKEGVTSFLQKRPASFARLGDEA
jgi:enoyl-CoA hydratase/carnithine racemase